MSLETQAATLLLTRHGLMREANASNWLSLRARPLELQARTIGRMNAMNSEIGRLIRDTRQTKGLTLNQVARAVKKSPQWLSAIESGSGDVLPNLALTLRLFQSTSISEAGRTADLSTWLLKWLESNVAASSFTSHIKDEPGDRDAFEALKAEALTVLGELNGRTLQRTPSVWNSTALPTLKDFPDAFEDLIVVCGDRREVPPKNKGDLFVKSFSCSDIVSLSSLFAKTGTLDIRSDKVFVLGDREYLKREFGNKNIIVIGSPAVNLLTREINGRGAFLFATPKLARDFIADNKTIAEINDRNLLEIFWKMASEWKGHGEIPVDAYIETYRTKLPRREAEDTKDFEQRISAQIKGLADKVKGLLRGNNLKTVMNKFLTAGFRDLADGQIHGDAIRTDNDFGIIALCSNPYSDDNTHLCILVAGIHGPGTDRALYALATENFRERPLGGVIEVRLNLDAGWIERLHTAAWAWQTDPYDIEKDILPRLENPEKQAVLSECAPEAIEHLKVFLRRFIEDKNKG
jgi:transcriptional regulator with XRE-family HTH domain